ncbi:MAG: hypothetical protein ACT4TC_01340 [Myxococcaceae bacterium]
MSALRAFFCAGALALVVSGCNRGGNNTEDGGYKLPDGGTTNNPDGGMSELEITDFAKDLILNHTADNNLPETTEDKTFKDSESSSGFPSSFFQ